MHCLSSRTCYAYSTPRQNTLLVYNVVASSSLIESRMSIFLTQYVTGRPIPNVSRCHHKLQQFCSTHPERLLRGPCTLHNIIPLLQLDGRYTLTCAIVRKTLHVRGVVWCGSYMPAFCANNQTASEDPKNLYVPYNNQIWLQHASYHTIDCLYIDCLYIPPS